MIAADAPPLGLPAFQELHLLALSRYRQGRAAEAISILRQAISLAPQRAFLHSNLSHLLSESGDFAGAIAAADAAIALEPGLVEAHLHRGNALQAMADLPAAIASFRRAVDLRASDSRGWGNLANALQTMGALEESLAAHRRAVALDCGNATLVSNFAAALATAGEIGAAIELHRRAVAMRGANLAPADAVLLSNLGYALQREGRLAEAEQAQRRALALNPELAQGHLNLAMLSLLQGRYREGWVQYEWRWRAAERFTDARRKWNRPRWDGLPLKGRTILLHAEQGFGDTIQFVRYVPEVVKLGGRVVLECQPGLRRLLEGSPLGQAVTIARRGSQIPEIEFDVQLPLGSLPLVLGKFEPGDCGREPYLSADEGLRAMWRQRLQRLGGRKVGLVWAGSPTHGDDRRRSMTLAKFAPLAESAATFVSLQCGAAAEQAATPPVGMRMVDWSGELSDWAATAALVAELDCVIGVDTAVVHLAGAMGKPVMILLPSVADWRWGVEGELTGWYSGARLVRQKAAGEWGGVVAEVRNYMQHSTSNTQHSTLRGE